VTRVGIPVVAINVLVATVVLTLGFGAPLLPSAAGACVGGVAFHLVFRERKKR